MNSLDILEQRIENSESFLVQTWNRSKKENEFSHFYPQKESHQDFKISYSDYKILLEDLLRLRLRGNRKGRSSTDLGKKDDKSKPFVMGDNIAQTIIDLKDKLNTALDQKRFLQNSMENIMKRHSETEQR
jgi:hypothetical protein